MDSIVPQSPCGLMYDDSEAEGDIGADRTLASVISYWSNGLLACRPCLTAFATVVWRFYDPSDGIPLPPQGGFQVHYKM